MIQSQKSTINKAPWIALSILLAALFFITKGPKLQDNRGQKTPFIHDVNNYYSYLPAAFIHQDLSFSFPHNYWMTQGPKGHKIAKGTMGMSILYSPFFGIAYLHASISGDNLNGYSPPFSFWIHFGTLLYALIAAYFLLRSLMEFFKPIVAVLSYFSILFGTNYYYYLLGQGELTHSYLFMLFSIIIWLSIKWHQKPNTKTLVGISLLCGLVSLIRPTDIIIILFPLLFGVYNWKSLKAKLKILGNNKLSLVIASVLFFLPLLPQLIYWKVFSGSFLFFSYGSEEGFFFNDPQILNVLFSFRKGWFIYTPLALIMALGIIGLWKSKNKLALPISLLLVLNIYIVSCWWDWWFGGSFGHRAFVQYYAILAFPLALMIQWGTNKWWKLLPFSGIVLFCIGLNIFQTSQFRHSIIHWEAMSKDAYYYVWGKKGLSAEEYKKAESLLVRPDYEGARNGKRDLK